MPVEDRMLPRVYCDVLATAHLIRSCMSLKNEMPAAYLLTCPARGVNRGPWCADTRRSLPLVCTMSTAADATSRGA
jgi:hypothetical protein